MIERIEKVKGALLMILVMLSIVLSVGLWNNTPVFEPLDQGGYIANPAFGLGKSVEQVLLPIRIRARLEDKSHTMVAPFTDPYEKAWDELRKLAVRELVPIDNPDSVRQVIRSGPHIEFQFGIGMNEEQVFQILKRVEPNQFQLKVSSIIIHRDASGISQVVLSDGDQPTFRGRIGGQTRLFEQLAQWTTLPKYVEHSESKGSFLIPNEKIKVPVITHERMLLPTDTLARSFFVDPTLTRRIQERDGSLIVTDGNRTVQISSKEKGIRYSSSIPYDKRTETMTKDNSFQRAVAFVNEHGGMQGSYIGRLQTSWGRDSREYIFNEYRYGLPVLTRLTGIQVALNGNEVVEMSRSVLYLGTEVKEEIVEVAPPQPPIKEQATDIYLAYAAKEDEGRIRLLPVWVVEYQRIPTLMYDAQTGEKWQDTGE